MLKQLLLNFIFNMLSKMGKITSNEVTTQYIHTINLNQIINYDCNILATSYCKSWITKYKKY